MNSAQFDIVKALIEEKKYDVITEYSHITHPEKGEIIVNEYAGNGVRVYKDTKGNTRVLCPKNIDVVQEGHVAQAIANGSIFDDADEVDRNATMIERTSIPYDAMINSGKDTPKQLKPMIAIVIGKMDDNGSFEVSDADRTNGTNFVKDLCDKEKCPDATEVVDNYLEKDSQDFYSPEMGKNLTALDNEVDDIVDTEPEDVVTDDDTVDSYDDYDMDKIESDEPDEDDEDDDTVEESGDMTSDLETYVSGKISKLVPNFEKIEFKAQISDASYSIEFFATIDGKRMQNFEMIDNGMMNEEEFDEFSKDVAQYVRSSNDYNSGEVNEYSFEIDGTSSGDNDITDLDDEFGDRIPQEYKEFLSSGEYTKFEDVVVSDENGETIIHRFLSPKEIIDTYNTFKDEGYKPLMGSEPCDVIPIAECNASYTMKSSDSEEDEPSKTGDYVVIRDGAFEIMILESREDKSEEPSLFQWERSWTDAYQTLSEQTNPDEDVEMVEEADNVSKTEVQSGIYNKTPVPVEAKENATEIQESETPNVQTPGDAEAGPNPTYKPTPVKECGDQGFKPSALQPPAVQTEGFLSKKPKKLKPIGRDVVAYITVEMNDIHSANDQAMLAGYTCSKIELVDFYLTVLDTQDARYIVPHNKQYLTQMRNDLERLLAQILRIRPINRSDQIWRVNYPT